MPRVLDRIVMMAIHRDPKQRFQTALDFDRALLRAGKYLTATQLDLRLVTVSALVMSTLTFSLLEAFLGKR